MVSVNRPRVPHISVAPRYMVLAEHIDQVRFQCYVDGQPAKPGQTMWVRKGSVISCDINRRVLACVNILIIARVTAQDVGQYSCISTDNYWNSYTVSVIGNSKSV